MKPLVYDKCGNKLKIEKKFEPLCILFIDSSVFREDYARIYDEIYKELSINNISILTILGPGSTKAEESRFKSYYPTRIEELTKGKQTWRMKYLRHFIAQMIKRKVPLSKRRPWTWYKFYTIFSAMVSFFEDSQPRLVISIKYDSCYPFVVAANSIRIPALAIQHGDYYSDTDVNYGDGSSSRRFHEWPASILLVWSQSTVEFCQRKFGNQHTYRSLNAPLWHARYHSKTTSSKDKIIIYESDLSLWSNSLINSIINSFGTQQVKVKPHPYYVSKSVSRAALEFPELLVSQPLWESIPKIGISFSSTVTDELIFNDCVCVTIARKEDIGVRFPYTGTFSLDDDYINRILLLLQELYTSKSKYQQILTAQKEERKDFVSSIMPVAKGIAKVCEEYITKK
ncbi:MAG: hypothetical protein NTY89_22185 [Nostocales cyanobacterium LacPavin_0920_SED1_MAG_38_18]|nr:hypothetical protein [Nostocales cyanobacterium LacPavin_0920_SED1_MAG_38_18]